MALPPGARVGPYDIVALIGQGGMGEVYRATDSNLKRSVAIKVLPASVAGDADRLARFRREAEVLAVLNHPNIAAIYGFEKTPDLTALVMEFVEGQDLSERIAHPDASAGSGIPLEEALPIARQIAEALEAAHEQGIVHRDLKPANVKLRPDGTVKVLDFGLAKAIEPAAAASPGLSKSPTITSPAMTQAGVILGTAAYMAPEQAKGKAVDRRADIWAFGCVFYEMLTGHRPFDGEDITDTIAAVVTKEPDWSRLPANTPPAIATLLGRCLEKSPQRRLPHIGVARLELETPRPASDIFKTPVTSSPQRPSGTRPAGSLIAMAVAAIALGAAAGVGWASRTAAPPADPVSYRASVLLPAEHVIFTSGPSSRFAISPDGRWLAYVAANGQEPHLWLRALDEPTAHVVEGTQYAGSPFWSPDSRFVAVFARERLLKADVRGGPAAIIAEDAAIRGQALPGTWSPADEIVFGGRNSPGEGLWRIPARGGRLERVTTPDASAGEDRHAFAQFLPDGRHLLYVAYNGITPVATYVTTLETPAERQRLMDGGSNTQVVDGALLYVRGSALVAQPFDAERRTLSGEPVTLASRILTNATIPFGGSFSASRAGAVVYHSAVPDSGLGLLRGDRLVWRTRTGAEQSVVGEPALYRSISVAPDGRRAVVSMLGENPSGLATDPGVGRSDLWIVDVARGVLTRFTFTNAERSGVWDPTGRTVFFNSFRNRSGDTANQRLPLDLYRKAASGGGAEEEVLVDGREKTPLSVSRDGRFLLYATRDGLWSRALDGSGQDTPFVTSAFSEDYGQFSPDGRWVAYTSDESGRSQIYVRAFPAGDRVVQVSSDGGDFPRWSADGRELYFFGAGKLVAARVAVTGGALEVTSVTPLFDCRPPDGFRRQFYDVAPDGRFLMMAPISTPGPTPLTLLVNWRAPTATN